MFNSTRPSAARPAPTHMLARCLSAAFVLTALAGLAQVVAAQQPQMPAAKPDTLMALSDDPHVLDPTGLCGGTVVDPFIANSKGQGSGRKVVRLPDGDIVVAALAPRHGFHPSPNGMWNLGLVRYRTPCSAVAWTAGPYRFPTSGLEPHRYLVYPNVDPPQFVAINDLKVFGQYLYVLVDRRKTTDLSSVRDAYVLIFGFDGSFVQQVPVLDTSLDERGGGMVFFADSFGGPTKLFVTGTFYSSTGRPTPTLARLTRSGGGTLTRDPWGPASSFFIDYPLPDVYCLPDARPCHSVSNAIAMTVAGGSLDRIYLGGAVRHSTTGDWDFLALAVDYNGVLDTGFSAGGRSTVAFDRGGYMRDVATAIVARSGLLSNQVFLVGEVHQQNSSSENAGNRGIGIVKLTHSGGYDHEFVNGGRVVFGGCPELPCVNLLGAGDAESFPRAVALAGNRLVVVGRERRRPGSVIPGNSSPHETASELMIVDRDSATLRDRNGSIPDADLFDVLIEPSGRITAAGVYVENDLQRALTVQFRADRLFGNGFQQP